MSERDETIDAPEGETLPLPVADDSMPAEEAEDAAEDDDEGDDATEEAAEPDA